MVYKATQDVVRRVMPLLDKLATRTIDKARLLQYLSARAGADWGILELVADLPADGPDDTRLIVFRDRATGAEHPLRYPDALPAAIEPMVLEEYKRLATEHTLSVMAPELFRYFFGASHCDHCRWRGEAFAPVHRECRFAGRPVNFEPGPAVGVPADAGPWAALDVPLDPDADRGAGPREA